MGAIKSPLPLILYQQKQILDTVEFFFFAVCVLLGVFPFIFCHIDTLRN